MKLNYDEFVQRYTDRSTTSQEREQLRKANPKHCARFNLTSHPGALKPGSTVFVVTRKHSRTGYSRTISLYAIAIRTDAGYHASKDDPAIQPLALTYNVAVLMGYRCGEYEGFDVLRTDDYPQEFVAHLSQHLFGIENASALRCETL